MPSTKKQLRNARKFNLGIYIPSLIFQMCSTDQICNHGYSGLKSMIANKTHAIFIFFQFNKTTPSTVHWEHRMEGSVSNINSSTSQDFLIWCTLPLAPSGSTHLDVRSPSNADVAWNCVKSGMIKGLLGEFLHMSKKVNWCMTIRETGYYSQFQKEVPRHLQEQNLNGSYSTLLVARKEKLCLCCQSC